MKKRRMPKATPALTKQKIFLELKKPDEFIVKKPQNTRDVAGFERIAPNGIMQIGKDTWSKSYRLQDVNYTTKTYDEQLAFFYDWCKNINTFDIAVKITVFNENRDMQEIREKIFYRHKEDNYDWLRDAYNDIMESKITEGRQ